MVMSYQMAIVSISVKSFQSKDSMLFCCFSQLQPSILQTKLTMQKAFWGKKARTEYDVGPEKQINWPSVQPT